MLKLGCCRCDIGKLGLYEAIKAVKKDQSLCQASEFSLVQDGLIIAGAGDWNFPVLLS